MEKEPAKKRRGRPRKNPVENPEVNAPKKRKKRINKIAEMAKGLAINTAEVTAPEPKSNEKAPENTQPVKRRRGRPRKNPIAVEIPVTQATAPEKKKRGRPRKNPAPVEEPITQNTATEIKPAKRRRGRPRKNPIATPTQKTAKTATNIEKPIIKTNTATPEKIKTAPVQQTSQATPTSLEVLVKAINNLTREVKILRRHLKK